MPISGLPSFEESLRSFEFHSSEGLWLALKKKKTSKISSGGLSIYEGWMKKKGNLSGGNIIVDIFHPILAFKVTRKLWSMASVD